MVIYVDTDIYVDNLIYVVMPTLLVPKWKKEATEFTVSINYHPTRGYQSSIPLPVMEKLGKPDKLTFVIKGSKIEITPEKHGKDKQ
jgi:hypothetical protein